MLLLFCASCLKSKACLSFLQGHCSLNLSLYWDIPKCKTQRTSPQVCFEYICKQQAVAYAGTVAQFVWLSFSIDANFSKSFLCGVSVLDTLQENCEENEKVHEKAWALFSLQPAEVQGPVLWYLLSQVESWCSEKTLKESNSVPLQLLHQSVEQRKIDHVPVGERFDGGNLLLFWDIAR